MKDIIDLSLLTGTKPIFDTRVAELITNKNYNKKGKSLQEVAIKRLKK